MIAGRRHGSLTFSEIDEHLYLKEDIGDQENGISIDDSDADPDYVFDQQIEEEEKLEAEYFSV